VEVLVVEPHGLVGNLGILGGDLVLLPLQLGVCVLEGVVFCLERGEVPLEVGLAEVVLLHNECGL